MNLPGGYSCNLWFDIRIDNNECLGLSAARMHPLRGLKVIVLHTKILLILPLACLCLSCARDVTFTPSPTSFINLLAAVDQSSFDNGRSKHYERVVITSDGYDLTAVCDESFTVRAVNEKAGRSSGSKISRKFPQDWLSFSKAMSSALMDPDVNASLLEYKMTKCELLVNRSVLDESKWFVQVRQTSPNGLNTHFGLYFDDHFNLVRVAGGK